MLASPHCLREDLGNAETGTPPPPKWVPKMEKVCAKLGVSVSGGAWTERPDILLDGLRRQQTSPIFLHSLLNARFIKYADHNKLSRSDLPIGHDIYVDVRQAYPRQKVNGRTTMLTRSVLFNQFPLMRTMHWREHFFHQEWGDSFNLEGICEPLGQDWHTAVETCDGVSATAKRRRAPHRSEEVVAKELIGAAYSLPEIYLMTRCALLAADNDVFAGSAVPFVEPLSEGVSDARVKSLEVDPHNIGKLKHSLAEAGDLSDSDAGLDDDGASS